MANVNVRNILVGAGDLYVTDDQTFGAQVEDPAFDGATGSFIEFMDGLAGFNYVGATQDGVELAYTPDYGEVEVDQLKGAALLFNQAVSVTASTTMAEATLINLAIAWGVADSALENLDTDTEGQRFNIGMPGDDPIERKLVIVGKGNPIEVTNPDYVDDTTTPDVPQFIYQPSERAYYARRVISAEGSTLALSRTDPTTYGVTFRLLPDGAEEGSEFGTIVDRLVGGQAAQA